jgi:hypothetical protein
MSRIHKLARSDHDHLSLRVAHQMQHAGSPAVAQRSRERLDDPVVINQSIDSCSVDRPADVLPLSWG